METVRLHEQEQQLSAALDGADPVFVECWTELDSTMIRAREILATVNNPTTVGQTITRVSFHSVVLAELQRRGRGRQGRGWESTPGAFLGTLTWTAPRAMLEKVVGLSLGVGVVVADVLAGFDAAVSLKWPNDLMSVDGQAKLGGILVEIEEVGGGIALLIGIGLNLAQRPPGVPTAGAIEGAALGVTSFAGKLCRALDRFIPVFLEQGFGKYRSRWLERAFGIGTRWVVDSGTSTITGTCCGVSDRGGLLLVERGEQRELLSGHVLRYGETG